MQGTASAARSAILSERLPDLARTRTLDNQSPTVPWERLLDLQERTLKAVLTLPTGEQLKAGFAAGFAAKARQVRASCSDEGAATSMPQRRRSHSEAVPGDSDEEPLWTSTVGLTNDHSAKAESDLQEERRVNSFSVPNDDAVKRDASTHLFVPRGSSTNSTRTTQHSYKGMMFVARTFHTLSGADADADVTLSTVTCGFEGIEDRTNEATRLEQLRDPSCKEQVIWGLIGMALLLQDLLLVPFVLAWQVPFEGAVEICTMISAVFWTLDMLVSSNKGYYSRGHLIVNPVMVIRRYVKSWATLDAALVILDWVYIATELGMNSSSRNDDVGTVRLVRSVRMVRMSRMFRAARLMKTFRDVQDFLVLSETSRFACYVLTLAAVVLLSTHVLACSWYAIGRYSHTDTGLRWIHVARAGIDLDFATASETYQYLTVYHWALAQLALGAIEIECTNTFERVFTVLSLLFGLFGSSTMISLLSACVLDWQARQQDKHRALEGVRKYLTENKVSTQLSYRVMQQVHTRITARTWLTPDTVPSLGLLSKHLRDNLQASIYIPVISTKPIFKLFIMIDERFATKLAKHAVFMRAYVTGDYVFHRGMQADNVFIHIQGHLTYDNTAEVQRPSSQPHIRHLATGDFDAEGFVPEVTQVKSISSDVVRGSWLAEPVLWCNWEYFGLACCRSPCKEMLIDHVSFVSSVQEHSTFSRIAHEYGLAYAAQVRAAVFAPDGAVADDLEVESTDLPEIAWSMDRSATRKICDHLMRHMDETGAESPSVLETLSKEVNDGECIVLPAGTYFERVVAVVLVSVADGGRKLMEIAKVKGGVVKDASCRLPGGKRKLGERVSQSIERYMRTHLEPLKDAVKLEEIHAQTSMQKKRGSNLRTRYFKLVCSMHLTDAVDIQCIGSVNLVPGGDPSSVSSHSSRHSGHHGLGHTFGEDLRATSSQVPPREVLFSPTAGGNGLDGRLYMWLSDEDQSSLNTPKGLSSLEHQLEQLCLHHSKPTNGDKGGVSSSPSVTSWSI